MCNDFKTNLYASLILLGINIFILYFCQLFPSAGIDGATYILYNKDPEPFFSLCGKNIYLTNFLLFGFTSLLCQIAYVLVFYLNKIKRLIKVNDLSDNNLKVNKR